MAELGRDGCNDPAVAGRREWLVTNGRGGFAMGTVAGFLTRRYHGLLLAALNPPLGRTLLVAKVGETVRYDGRTYELDANRWADGTVAPRGFIHLDRFHLEGTMPVWTYALGDALLEKRVWMEQGANTTYVRYDVLRARAPVTLTLKALVSHRDFHGSMHAENVSFDIGATDGGIRMLAAGGAPVHLRSAEAAATPAHDWYRGFHRSVEEERGLEATEDHLHAATFEATVESGAACTFVASTESGASLDGDAALERQRDHERSLIEQADVRDEDPPEIRQLILAADQFIVERPTPVVENGRSIIAGYPWFGDWGRDTMIALSGLTLATGRPDVARRILQTFAHFIDEGMIPNRFPDAGDAPEYNTVDATLWMFEAVRAYHAATGDDELLQALFPALAEVVEWHQRGTRYQIRVDPDDGLLRAGEPGVQLTWMDAKVDDWVVTPRIGKPVEINALWYHALRCMAAFAEQLDAPPDAYADAANRVAATFHRFWNDDAGCCYDVIDGPDGTADPKIRPNQLLAASLAHSPLPAEQQRAVVDACSRHLVTPHGLRSLAPDTPGYEGRYEGDVWARDGAYHQGTVWSWLIGPFLAAHHRAYGDADRTRSYLDPLLRHLPDHGMGSISEVFDGDPPFTPRGCPAQAWGVAQVLDAWRQLHAS